MLDFISASSLCPIRPIVSGIAGIAIIDVIAPPQDFIREIWTSEKQRQIISGRLAEIAADRADLHVQELRIESFLPINDDTAAIFRAWASRPC